jgi:hypothetical protein
MERLKFSNINRPPNTKNTSSSMLRTQAAIVINAIVINMSCQGTGLDLIWQLTTIPEPEGADGNPCD